AAQAARRSAVRCVLRSTPIHGKSRRCRLGHVISCVQSLLITWDMYTDHQSTDDQCALMISVAPEVPAVQCAEQCHLPVPISAYQCTSMPHISAHLSCILVSPMSAKQCQLSVLPVSARIPVPISDACQCPSVSPTS
ncbi:unnamed protein product, partial [Staurois parvus]